MNRKYSTAKGSSDSLNFKVRRMRGSVAQLGPRYQPLTAHSERRGTTAINDSLEVISLDKSESRNGPKLENTYKLEPDNVFKLCDVETIANKVLKEKLADVTYDSEDCKDLSQSTAATILEKIKSIGFKRYKIIANVSIGSLKEKPGMQFGSRCLWNKNTDNFVSIKYSNSSIFAVAMIYGLYFD